MRQIRKNIFETNSSSVHSLQIDGSGLEPSNLKLDNDGYIRVEFGSFGREYRIYSSQYEKLQYLITCLYYLTTSVEEIYDSYDFERICNIVCDYTGAFGIKIIGDENKAYIDHQSIPYDGIDIVNTYDEDEVKNFIFNKYISLKTDCD